MHGDKIGRTIGFPTANLNVDDERKLLPAAGVYAVKVFLLGKEYTGISTFTPGSEIPQLPAKNHPQQADTANNNLFFISLFVKLNPYCLLRVYMP